MLRKHTSVGQGHLFCDLFCKILAKTFKKWSMSQPEQDWPKNQNVILVRLIYDKIIDFRSISRNFCKNPLEGQTYVNKPAAESCRFVSVCVIFY